MPREVETESKSVSRVTDHDAIGRIGVRFKRGTNFVQVAELKFGIELEDPSPVFTWQITFNVMSRYLRLDDLLRSALRVAKHPEPPGQAHKGQDQHGRLFVAPGGCWPHGRGRLQRSQKRTGVRSRLRFCLRRGRRTRPQPERGQLTPRPRARGPSTKGIVADMRRWRAAWA